MNLYNTTPGGSVDQITTLPAGGAKLWLESVNVFMLQKAPPTRSATRSPTRAAG